MNPNLDFHHLRYFWAVATEGSMSAAAGRLGVTQPTVSAQIQSLEQDLGHQLIDRRGRRIELTATGRVVFQYAEEIFKAGEDLLAAVEGKGETGPLVLEVGVGDSVPKPVALAVLRPVFQLSRPVRIICREWRMDQLLAELARERMDLVLADAVAPPNAPGHPVSHSVAQSRIGMFARPEMAAKYREGFPRSLDGAPVVLPTPGISLRANLDGWFTLRGISPRIVVETEDRAMMHHFAMEGVGMGPVPGIIASDVARQFRLELVGWLPGVREHYFAVSVARKQHHPAIVEIREQSRKGLLFQGLDPGDRGEESEST